MFALTGDGNHTRAAIGRTASEGLSDPELTGAALTEARYRDWYAARAAGTPAIRARAETANGTAAPPALTLTPDDGAAVQTRMALGGAAHRRDHAAERVRLGEATAIIRALVEEFGELFPEELAAAAAFLKRDVTP